MSEAKIHQTIADAMIRVTEAAAIAAFDLAGRGDEKEADQAAVDAMRTSLNQVAMQGRIVIGEGERDEAPMLYIGEEVGTGVGPEIDIALDPLEGTTLTAKAMGNALAVLALAPRGTMLFSPDVYMDKIAIGPGYSAGVVSLDASPAENVEALAKAKGVSPRDISVCILDRPRHQNIIDSVRSVGGRVVMIMDGDIAGVINTTDPSTGVDMYLGLGGAPEGVLAASALKCIGGQMEARLVFRNDEEKSRAKRVGITDLNKLYTLEDLVTCETVFCATGVTKGGLLDGVSKSSRFVETETMIMTSIDGSIRRVRTRRPV
ncbi:class II fructose-bisphosphatase [Ponticaulis sp.]|uniref:class II fructose-bisphosphatase n=1 Tax=Ponticaulis sp. TaxID=2020902 RepID=UPI000B676EBD|nr:class II fructose-bisphosphatase [Ponticaulis sp.]MAI89363.1 fructose-bisphosphatase class II [Ponticaulis sp.]OUY00404.1 MAG: fructose-bisphosphatase class II [Hyphomonadaceae bacterium TMED5]|tara:strand:+ start:430 stop:1383 length:954 start_codon:yes stop_codon:yes gene_type:complete